MREWLDDYMIAWMGVVAVYTLCVHDMNDGLLCSLCMSDVCVCVQTMGVVANMLLMYKQSLVVHEWLKLKYVVVHI